MMIRAILWPLSVVVAVLLSAGVTFFVMYDTRKDLPLTVFSREGSSAEAGGLDGKGFADLSAPGKELCGSLEGCIEAAKGPHSSFYRFSTEKAARAFARMSDSRYPSGWIVVEFVENNLTEAEQQHVKMVLDETWIPD